WARELAALGHEVRLMPAQYAKAYIKRNKHDAADAEAICEAVQRPTMRFVLVKTAEQQAARLLPVHRDIDPARVMRPRFADSIRASSPSRLREQPGPLTPSDFFASPSLFSCQAGALNT